MMWNAAIVEDTGRLGFGLLGHQLGSRSGPEGHGGEG